MEEMKTTPTPEKVLSERENKFLQIRFPLSPQGEDLKKAILAGTASEDDLPTVEKPHLELFADFDALDQSRITEIFDEGLANIQITKGCRHQCTFCAAGASKEVETMPFPAVLKSAEYKKKLDGEVERQMEDWIRVMEEETGLSIEQIRKIRLEESGLPLEEINRVGSKIAQAFQNHPLYQTLRKYNPDLVEHFDKHIKIFGHLATVDFHQSIPVDYRDSDSWVDNLLPQVTNYYDSDPFDYKDRTFTHQDGTPADFGDVAEALASKVRPIHITTAGWSKTDKIAQRAAEKIIKMGPEYFKHVRLSVNQFEIRARKNPDIYLEDTKNSIQILASLGLEVIIFDNKEDPKYTSVIKELEEFIKGVPGIKIKRPNLSYYSGPMKKEEEFDDHHDVMACMDGYHIWPNGTIAVQERIFDKFKQPTAPEGARPTPNGEKLWK